MNEFVLDCSVTAAWCFKDENDAYADSVLESLRTSYALAPSIWAMEVANVLLVGERRKRLTDLESLQFIEMLDLMPIRVIDFGFDQIAGSVLPLAKKHALTVYDACYLALAQEEALPIATGDRVLRKAAKACGVPLFSPA